MPFRAAVAPLELFVDYFGEPPGPDAGPREFWTKDGDSCGATKSYRFQVNEGFIFSHKASDDPESCKGYLTSPSQKCNSCFERLYFLSHVHEDEVHGLTSTWKRGFICCSAASRALILMQHPSLSSRVLPLQLNVPYVFLIHPQSSQRLPHQRSSEGSASSTRQRRRCCTRSRLKPQNPCGNGLGIATIPDPIASYCGSSHDSFHRAILDMASASAEKGVNRTRCFSCGARVESVYVRLVDARHCPGSVILVLRGRSFGTIVHTGDFCCNGSTRDQIIQDVRNALYQLQNLLPFATAGDTVASTSLEESGSSLQEEPNLIEPLEARSSSSIDIYRKPIRVDVLFIDNTYLHPKFTFDDETSIVQQISCFIYKALMNDSSRQSLARQNQRARLPVVVLVGLDGLGKEGLLSRIASQFRVQVELSGKRFDAIAAAAGVDAKKCSMRHFRRGYSWKCLALAVRATAATTGEDLRDRCNQPGEAGKKIAAVSDIPRQPLTIAAVPGGRLFRLIQVLSSPSVNVVGVLPSAHFKGALSRQQVFPACHPPCFGFFNYSLHSSFHDLCYFVKGLLPSKVVLLKPLPGRRISWDSCARPLPPHTAAAVVSEKHPAAKSPLTTLPEHQLTDQPESSVPEVATAADTLRILHIACKLRSEMNPARTSGALPAAVSMSRGSSVATAVFRHLFSPEITPVAYNSQAYDGEEGLVSFVKSTGVSCIVLGRGRQDFQVGKSSRVSYQDLNRIELHCQQQCQRIRQQAQSSPQEQPPEQLQPRRWQRMPQTDLSGMRKRRRSGDLKKSVDTSVVERLQQQRVEGASES